MTSSNELRQMFLDYFVDRDHTLVASAPLVPPDDPTMLFTSAGMVQFKPLYAGTVDPLPYRRATTCQKCLRAGGKGSDLENVGKTLRHHTFFEMLGNFSFGDYFKREALEWGWDFVWNRMKLPKERLWATIFEEDDEAEAILEKDLGIPRDRIVRLDAKENFWGPAGETGACGPCSEIIFLMGSEAELDVAAKQSNAEIARRVVEEGDLFLEIWNMVFPQFDQQPDGSRPPLRNRGIDTGAGLERMTTAMQFLETGGRIRSPYDSDLMRPITMAAARELGVERQRSLSLRVRRLIEWLSGDYRTRELVKPLKDFGPALNISERGISRADGQPTYRRYRVEILDGSEVASQKRDNIEREIRPINDRLQEGIVELDLCDESKVLAIDDSANLPLFAANAVADHARALTFVLSEGIMPSNDGRGYVPRRILRRALRFASLTDMAHSAEEARELDPFLHHLVDPVVETMGDAYPEIRPMRNHVRSVIRQEEENFLRTMKEGEKRLREMIGKARRREDRTIAGQEIFELHATHGYPPDMTYEIIDDYNKRNESDPNLLVKVDRDGYRKAMAEHKELARTSWKGAELGDEAVILGDVYDQHGETGFLGYDTRECQSHILAVVKSAPRRDPGAKLRDATAGDKPPKTMMKCVEEAEEGETATVVLEGTPFYAESGGQIGDQGVLESGDGRVRFAVSDTRKTPSGIVLHRGVVEKGAIRVGETLTARVDAARRLATARNHTVTHLLQAALRKVVGRHITQSGSWVGPEAMRFDFSHVRACAPEELARVERIVNENILRDLPVTVEEMPIDEARKRGAIAPFGEKYGHVVRVVEIGEQALAQPPSAVNEEKVSVEFCGGTHLDRTGRIGSFRILSESSVAAGIRRIEGATGLGAYERWAASRDVAADLCRSLAVKEDGLVERVGALQDEVKKLSREIKRLKQAKSSFSVDDLIAGAAEVEGIKVVAAKIEDADPEQLRNVADQIRDRLPHSVSVLGATDGKKVSLICAVTKTDTSRVKAGDVIKQAAAIVGGSGGGRPDLAQAGGKNPEKLDEAIERAPAIVARLLSG